MPGSPTWKLTIAKRGEIYMALTRVERERLKDSQLKLHSITDSLTHVDPKKVPDLDEIQDCLEDAEKSLRGALGSEN